MDQGKGVGVFGAGIEELRIGGQVEGRLGKPEELPIHSAKFAYLFVSVNY
jgi:hypothetical protein